MIVSHLKLPTRARRISGVLAATSLLAGGMVFTVRSVPAFASDATDTTAYSLQRTFNAGDVDRYKIALHTVLKAGDTPTDIMLNMTLKETTKEVKPDGGVVLVDKYEQVAGKFGPQDIDLTEMMPVITQTRDKDGNVDFKAEGGNEVVAGQIGPMLQGLTRSQTAFYPKKAIKIGDSWKIDFKGGTAQQPAPQVTGTATLTGTETLNGVQTLKIKFSMDTAGADQTASKIHSEGTFNMDTKTGKPVRMVDTATGTLANGGGDVKIDFTTDLLPADAKTNTP